MACPPDRKYSLYFVRDPRDGSVRYIGISSKPRMRFRQHVGSPYSKMSDLVCELRKYKLKLALDVVIDGLTLSQAELIERRLIFFHQSMRPGKLFNCRVIPRKINSQIAMSQVPFATYQRGVTCDFCGSTDVVRWTEHDTRRPVFFSGGWKFFNGRGQHLCPACVSEGREPMHWSDEMHPMRLLEQGT